jgi:superfamily I DNA/RNA helicase
MTMKKASRIIGSPEQKNFWYELVNGDKHIMLEARAGTGKTFSCIEGCRQYLVENSRAKIAMVAYNKSIATELEAQVPEEVTACTMHSLGYKAIRNHVGGKVKVNNWKTVNILEELLGKEELKKLGSGFQYSMKKVASLAKNVLVSRDNFDKDFDSMISHYNIQLNGDEAMIKKLLPRVLSRSLEILDEIDFDDMIWLPVVIGMELEKFDILFVDEAQDLNRPRQQLAIGSLADEGRLIAVGDPKQAIYGFAGADVYSMRNLAYELGHDDSRSVLDVIHFPLTVSRRCPKKHIELAQKIVNDIKPMEDAIEGTVKHISHDLAIKEMKGGDLVLCRMNAPLMKIAYSLIKEDIPVTIQGRDIGTSLAALCKKLVKGNLSTDILAFTTKLHEYHVKEMARLDKKALNARVSESQYEMIIDRTLCIQAISEGLSTVQDVVNRIENLFSDNAKGGPKSKVLLSSVHRAKGLEAETVYISNPEKMPHPMAKLEWEISQEFNIKYVAMTRSMNTLVFMEGE